MQLKRRAALNGAQLDALDARILIQSIEPQAGKEQVNTAALWGADGSRVTAQHREYLDVIIKFSLDIRGDDYTERSEILEKVNGWAAGGGILTLSTKPGRKLVVVAQQLPGDGDALAWTNRFAITLRAYGVPYWQEAIGNTLQVENADSCNRQFEVPGNVRSTLNAEFTNTSGSTINTFTIRSGDAMIKLADLGLANNETLVINHADDGARKLLLIRSKETGGTAGGAMNKRTADSSDDLWTVPGAIRVRMSAGGTGSLLVTAAGRYA